MVYLLIAVSIALFSTQGLNFKLFSVSFQNKSQFFFFSFFYQMGVAAILLAVNGGFGDIRVGLALLALLFGAVFVGTVLAYMQAMTCGPLSFTTLLHAFGLLVPVIVGALFWNETPSVMQVVALALLFVTFYIGSNAASESGAKKANLRWLTLTVLSMLGNGAILTLYKVQQRVFGGAQKMEFLILAFAAASVLSAVAFLCTRKAPRQPPIRFSDRKMVLMIVIGAVVTAFGNLIALTLSGRVPAVIQFPLVNGGTSLATAVFSMVVFKERRNARSIFGLALGLVALVLIAQG